MGEWTDWAALAETLATEVRRWESDVVETTAPAAAPTCPPSAERRHSPRRAAGAASTVRATTNSTRPAAVVSRGKTAIQVNLFGRALKGSTCTAAQATAPAAATHTDSAGHPTGPTLAGLEKVRAGKRKAPEGPRGRNKAGRTSKESSVPLIQRLKQFADMGLKVSANKLFCGACKEELPNLKEHIRRHLSSTKHTKNFEASTRRQQAENEQYEDIADYFLNNANEHGASLPTSVHVFRMKVVRSFLISGTPLSRLSYFKHILERDGFTVVDHSHMASYIPRIEEREFELLKREVKGQFIGIAFDGTSRLGEAVNITGRWCSSDFHIVMRLLRFITTKLHLKHKEFAALITRVLCSELGTPPDMLSCLSRDSVLVNGATCRVLTQSPFTCAENQMCIAHTLNNCGGKIQFGILKEWMTPWLELVGGRHPHRGAQAMWRSAVAPTAVPGYSAVRWHSLAEIQFVLFKHFEQIKPFIDKLDEYGYGEATRQKLRNIVDDDTKFKCLRLQLAAIMDMKRLVQTTYELEGDRLELLLVYDRIEALRQWGSSIRSCTSNSLPYVDEALRCGVRLKNGTVISKIFHGHGGCTAKIIGSRLVDSTIYIGEKRMAYNVKYDIDSNTQEFEEEEIRPLLVVESMPERKEIIAAVMPAFDYLESRITGMCETSEYSCAHMYHVAKVSRAFDPSYAYQQMSESHVEELVSTILPLTNHICSKKLMNEMPKYMAMAKDFEVSHEDVNAFSQKILRFWRSTSDTDMSEWRKAARITFSLSPNSAACERVFSLLQNMYGEAREHVLADHIQSSLMLRYNQRSVMD